MARTETYSKTRPGRYTGSMVTDAKREPGRVGAQESQIQMQSQEPSWVGTQESRIQMWSRESNRVGTQRSRIQMRSQEAIRVGTQESRIRIREPSKVGRQESRIRMRSQEAHPGIPDSLPATRDSRLTGNFSSSAHPSKETARVPFFTTCVGPGSYVLFAPP